MQEGSVVAGKYRLERPLAKGGMGAVWVARHLQLDVPLAIKFMDPEGAASPESRARFEREAKACARLQSPHVVQVHDYGVEDGTPYLVMELLAGEDLGARLRREGRLSIPAAASVIAQAARGLGAAHAAGIIHRDLKPGNVFLAQQSGGGELVKVLDFGLAKAPKSRTLGDATKTGTLLGTPHYMSPEQTRNSKDLDHRTDLWSLGVILFRALTGRLPFPGDEIAEVLVAIATDPVPRPSQVAPDLGPEVDRFFERALARDPARRFQSAGELAEAFAAIAAPATSAGGAPARVSDPSIARPSWPTPAPATPSWPTPAPATPSWPTPAPATPSWPTPAQGHAPQAGHAPRASQTGAMAAATPAPWGPAAPPPTAAARSLGGMSGCVLVVIAVAAIAAATLLMVFIAQFAYHRTGAGYGADAAPPPRPDTDAAAPPPPATLTPAAAATCGPGPCCGGIGCEPAQQDASDSICAKRPDRCSPCRSGRACVAGACRDLLAPDRPWLLRLARVEPPPPAGSRVCVRRTAGGPRICTAAEDAAEVGGVPPARAMASRLQITTADLVGGGGIDIEVLQGERSITSRPGAAHETRIKQSALCVGLDFQLPDARVTFYLDDP